MVAANPIEELQQITDRIVELLDSGHPAEARAMAAHLREVLQGDPLFTTTQAARMLDIRSLNTLKTLLKVEGVHTVPRGNRTMIPLSEILRIQNSERVRGIRATDRLHTLSEGLGTDEGLSSEELEDLAAARPGKLPWQTA